MSKQRIDAVVADIDDLTEQQLDARFTQSMEHIAEIKRLWPGLVRLSEKDRKQSIGRNLTALSSPLRTLFSLLITKDGKETPLGKVFHVLGDKDEGDDPERFEPELLLRRMHRIEAQAKVLEELGDFSRHLGDDVLNTSEMVLAPGLLALDLARSVAKGNGEFRSALAPVLDALRNMTKKARQRRAEQPSGAAPAPGPSGVVP